MPSEFAQILSETLPLTNELMGVVSSIEQTLTGQVFDDVMVIINKNKKVTDEFNSIVGFRNEANFLKSQYVPSPRPGDMITTADGEQWRVNGITSDTTIKWYVEVVQAYEYG